MIRVGINGYGTIGRRVANAVQLQRDMKVVGIVKTRPDYVARVASSRFSIFVPDESYLKAFDDAGIKVKGVLSDLIRMSDVVVDATPEGQGKKNTPMYRTAGVKAVFQGGEEAGVADVSFNAYSCFDSAVGKSSARVVSCNTTGLARSLHALHSEFGVEHVDGTIIRRATDPNDHKKGPINALEPSLKIPSHHAPDLRTVLPVDIDTVAIKAPTTLMHIHVLNVTLKKEVQQSDVISAFSSRRRIMLVDGKDGVSSTAQVMDLARELGRDRSDMYELVIWRDAVRVSGRRVSYIQAVHQESDVVPENVDAIRALMGSMERDASIDATDSSLNIGGMKIYG